MITKVCINRGIPLDIGEYTKRSNYLQLKKPIILYPKPYNELVRANGIDENGHVRANTYVTSEMEDVYRQGDAVEISILTESMLKGYGTLGYWWDMETLEPTNSSKLKDFK